MAADAGVAALLEQLAVESPTTIETLPEELHPLILQFLDAPSLVAAAGVCRAWQRHAEAIALQKLHRAWPFEGLPPSRLRALCADLLVLPPGSLAAVDVPRTAHVRGWRAVAFHVPRRD